MPNKAKRLPLPSSYKKKLTAGAQSLKRKSLPPKLADPPDADTPAPRPTTIAGPTAEELAAHGSAFLSQASLVRQRVDNPQTATRKDIMSDTTFQRRELAMHLALLGMGEVYVARLYRLTGVVHALEKRLFSEEGLAHLSRADLLKRYDLACREMDKSFKFMRIVLSTVDMAAIRRRLEALRAQSAARPPAAQDNPSLSELDPEVEELMKRDLHPSTFLHELYLLDRKRKRKKESKQEKG